MKTVRRRAILKVHGLKMKRVKLKSSKNKNKIYSINVNNNGRILIGRRDVGQKFIGFLNRCLNDKDFAK